MSRFRILSPSSIIARSSGLDSSHAVVPASTQKFCSITTSTYSHDKIVTPLERNLSKNLTWTLLKNSDQVVTLQSRSFSKKRKKKKASKSAKEVVEEGEASRSGGFVIEDDVADGDGEQANDEVEPPLPSTESVMRRMESVLSSMELAYKAFLPSPDAMEVPLCEVARVVVPSSRLAVLTPHDPDLAEDVRNAVRDADLGLSPVVGDQEKEIRIFLPKVPAKNRERLVKEVGRIPLPKVSSQTRQRLVKEVGQTTEKYRQRVRGVRHKTNHRIKQAKEGKLEGVSKDEAFKAAKDIDKVTEKIMKKINNMLHEKERSIMNVRE